MKEILVVQRKRKVMTKLAEKLTQTNFTSDYTHSLFKWKLDWWK